MTNGSDHAVAELMLHGVLKSPNREVAWVDETFYYVCEPHVANNMKGEIIVGAGTVEDSSDDSLIVVEAGLPDGLFVTDSTTSFTFEVTVSDQYQDAATSKEFIVNVDIPFTKIEYGNMSGHATSFIDQNIFYSIAQDPNINSIDNIFTVMT